MTHWKALLLPLAVLLPLLAYVAGTLTTGQERPTQPEPVLLRDEDPDRGPAPREDFPAQRDGPRTAPRDEDLGRGHDDGGRSGENGRDDDEDDPEVVLPSPTRLDDGETDDDDGDVEDESDDGGGDD